MEIALAMISFFGLVVSWFVLPAAPRPSRSTTRSTSEALPAAA